jgi:ribosomal-protein-alanine N-acetyltransferase
VLLREAQAVVCLSANHLYALSDAVPPEKLYLLGGGIADPYGGDLAAYETVASQIAAALPPLHAAIQAACTVRDTRWEDLAVIAALEADAFSEPRSLPMLELEYAWENNHFLTAEADGKVVGYLSYQTAADEASILDFTVAQDRRGQGIGSKLMARMEASAALQGCLTVWLEVRASNPARKLYRARSYRKAQVRKGMYSKPAEDGIVMALTVQ